jgi:hypothetical protein
MNSRQACFHEGIGYFPGDFIVAAGQDFAGLGVGDVGCGEPADDALTQ